MALDQDEETGQDAAAYSFTYAGATMVVEERGAGARTFVLVHGIGMGRGVFDGLVDILASHGRVIAIDQPGYGDAPEPARTLTMERTGDLIGAFLALRRATGVVLIGHSMGTQVVTEVEVRHPDAVDGLVLVAPTVDARARTAPRQIARLARDLAIESPAVVMKGAGEFLRAGPNLRGKMHAMLVHRPEDAYPRVACPVLVLRGEDDRVSPREWVQTVVALLPDARFAEVAGHGHETMIRDPQPAAAHILAFARTL